MQAMALLVTALNCFGTTGTCFFLFQRSKIAMNAMTVAATGMAFDQGILCCLGAVVRGARESPGTLSEVLSAIMSILAPTSLTLRESRCFPSFSTMKYGVFLWQPSPQLTLVAHCPESFL